jgi:hypothetical protein
MSLDRYRLPDWYMGSPAHASLRQVLPAVEVAPSLDVFCTVLQPLLETIDGLVPLHTRQVAGINDAVTRAVQTAPMNPSRLTAVLALATAAAVRYVAGPEWAPLATLLEGTLVAAHTATTLDSQTRHAMLVALVRMNTAALVTGVSLPKAVRALIERCEVSDVEAVSFGLAPPAATTVEPPASPTSHVVNGRHHRHEAAGYECVAAVDGLLCIYSARWEGMGDAWIDATWAHASVLRALAVTVGGVATAAAASAASSDNDAATRAMLALENVTRTVLKPAHVLRREILLRVTRVLASTNANGAPAEAASAPLHELSSLMAAVATACCAVAAHAGRSDTVGGAAVLTALKQPAATRHVQGGPRDAGLRFPLLKRLFFSGTSAADLGISSLNALTDKDIDRSANANTVFAVATDDRVRLAAAGVSGITVGVLYREVAACAMHCTALQAAFANGALRLGDVWTDGAEAVALTAKRLREAVTAAVFDLMAASFPSGIMFVRAATGEQVANLQQCLVDAFVAVHAQPLLHNIHVYGEAPHGGDEANASRVGQSSVFDEAASASAASSSSQVLGAPNVPESVVSAAAPPPGARMRLWMSTLLHRLREALAASSETMLASVVKSAVASPARASELGRGASSASLRTATSGGGAIDAFVASLRHIPSGAASEPSGGLFNDSLVLQPYAGSLGASQNNMNAVHTVINSVDEHTVPVAAEAAETLAELRNKYCANLASLLLATLSVPPDAPTSAHASSPATSVSLTDHCSVLDDVLDAIGEDGKVPTRRRAAARPSPNGRGGTGGAGRGVWNDRAFILDLAASVLQSAVRRCIAHGLVVGSAGSVLARAFTRVWTVLCDQYMQFSLEYTRAAPGAGAPASFSTRVRNRSRSTAAGSVGSTAAAYAQAHGIQLYLVEVLLSVDPPPMVHQWVSVFSAVIAAADALRQASLFLGRPLGGSLLTSVGPSISDPAPGSPAGSAAMATFLLDPMAHSFQRLSDLMTELAWPTNGRLHTLLKATATPLVGSSARLKADDLIREAQLQVMQLLAPLLPLAASVAEAVMTTDSVALGLPLSARGGAIRAPFRMLWAMLVWHDLPMIAKCARLQVARAMQRDPASFQSWGYQHFPAALFSLARLAPPLLRFKTSEYVPAVTSYNGFAAALGVSATPVTGAPLDSAEALLQFVGHQRLIRHVDVGGRINGGEPEINVLRLLGSQPFEPFQAPTAPTAAAAWPVVSQLPFGEVFLFRCIMELEVVRGATDGACMAVPLTYMDYDVKHFAAAVHSKATDASRSSAAGATALASTGWSGPTALVILIRSVIERGFQSSLATIAGDSADVPPAFATAAALATPVRSSAAKELGATRPAAAPYAFDVLTLPTRCVRRFLRVANPWILTLEDNFAELLAVLASREVPHSLVTEAQSALDNIVFAGIHGPDAPPSFVLRFAAVTTPIVRRMLEFSAVWEATHDGSRTNRVETAAHRWLRSLVSASYSRAARRRRRSTQKGLVQFLGQAVRLGDTIHTRVALRAATVAAEASPPGGPGSAVLTFLLPIVVAPQLRHTPLTADAVDAARSNAERLECVQRLAAAVQCGHAPGGLPPAVIESVVAICVDRWTCSAVVHSSATATAPAMNAPPLVCGCWRRDARDDYDAFVAAFDGLIAERADLDAQLAALARGLHGGLPTTSTRTTTEGEGGDPQVAAAASAVPPAVSGRGHCLAKESLILLALEDAVVDRLTDCRLTARAATRLCHALSRSPFALLEPSQQNATVFLRYASVCGTASTARCLAGKKSADLVHWAVRALCRWFAAPAPLWPFTNSLSDKFEREQAEEAIEAVEHLIGLIARRPAAPEPATDIGHSTERRQHNASSQELRVAVEGAAVGSSGWQLDEGVKHLLILLLRSEHSRILLWITPIIGLAARAAGVAPGDESALIGVGARYDAPWSGEWTVVGAAARPFTDKEGHAAWPRLQYSEPSDWYDMPRPAKVALRRYTKLCVDTAALTDRDWRWVLDTCSRLYPAMVPAVASRFETVCPALPILAASLVADDPLPFANVPEAAIAYIVGASRRATRHVFASATVDAIEVDAQMKPVSGAPTPATGVNPLYVGQLKLGFFTASGPNIAHLHSFRRVNVPNALRVLLMFLPKSPAVRTRDPATHWNDTAVAFAIDSLTSSDPATLLQYLPQFLQLLRHDRPITPRAPFVALKDGALQYMVAASAAKSEAFAHGVLWALRTEFMAPEELLANATRASQAGTYADSLQLPNEAALSNVVARRCCTLAKAVVEALTPEARRRASTQFGFVDSMIAVSGELKSVTKPERLTLLRKLLRAPAAAVARHVAKLGTSEPLYIPTAPGTYVKEVNPDTALALQSAAKCPILVHFKGCTAEAEAISGATAPLTRCTSIFKYGDDCRQDQLALQIIGAFKRAFDRLEIPCFLFPYGVVTVAMQCGVIECVPNTKSRDQVGKLVEGNLYDYFAATYGPPYTTAFRAARANFIRSMAAYSVVSHLLNIKDRHNGNILLTDEGHLVHIDFGFLFDLSPGGDMNFEASPFKLTTEMLMVIGATAPSEEEPRIDQAAQHVALSVASGAPQAAHLLQRHQASGAAHPCFQFDPSIQSVSSAEMATALDLVAAQIAGVATPAAADSAAEDLSPLAPSDAPAVHKRQLASLRRKTYEDRLRGYLDFVHATVQCFLAARSEVNAIVGLVEPMLESGLPCFKPSKTINDLRARMALGMTDIEATSIILGRIRESGNNMRTNLYDRYQNMAEGIEW